MRAAVVVLGDLARSPRMVLHARALARAGAEVDLIGFSDAGWDAEGREGRIRVWPLPPHREGTPSSRWFGTHVPYVLRAAARGAGLLLALVRRLCLDIPRPDLILVQNPPGVPTLMVAWLAARTRGARFVIDWHNLTWTMLALRVGSRHWLVTVVSAYERFFGRRADANLFVSEAMRQALGTRWQVHGAVFRDRPAGVFRPPSAEERVATRKRLLAGLGEPPDAAIVVTSTSWTSDEDFDLLLAALQQFDGWARAVAPEARVPPRTVVLITGRGPLRAVFERRVQAAGLVAVGVHTLWLEAGEYGRVLGAADLGVCLHRSSSGLDLPMKVLDMFGVGLPVCALDYGPCLTELITDGVTGLLFRTSDDLASHLRALLEGFPGEGPLGRRRAAGGAREGAVSWEEGWALEARPHLLTAVAPHWSRRKT